MREEFTKKHFEVDGVTVYDDGVDFIFTAKNEKGEDVEHHITKVDPISVGEEKTPVALKKVLEASVAFPNLPITEALKEFDKRPKEKGKK
ncbi:MAG: hypothetical protein Q7R75_02285 [bacterium]|nr:hypothetical protein [bacterium]